MNFHRIGQSLKNIIKHPTVINIAAMAAYLVVPEAYSEAVKYLKKYPKAKEAMMKKESMDAEFKDTSEEK